MQFHEATKKRVQILAEQLVRAQVINPVTARTVATQLSFELGKAFAEQFASDFAKERFGGWESVDKHGKDDHQNTASKDTSFTLGELNIIAEKRQRYALLLLIWRYVDSGGPKALEELRLYVAWHYGEFLDAWDQLRVENQRPLIKEGESVQACGASDAQRRGPKLTHKEDARQARVGKPRKDVVTQAQYDDLQEQINVLQKDIARIKAQIVLQNIETLTTAAMTLQTRQEIDKFKAQIPILKRALDQAGIYIVFAEEPVPKSKKDKEHEGSADSE